MKTLFENYLNWPSFATQLRFWSLHAGLGAIPSFALGLMATGAGGIEIIAMVLGVASLIMGYALATSTHFYQRISGGVMGQAFRLALQIRMWVTGAGILGVVGFFIPGAMLLALPDMMAGMLAGSITSRSAPGSRYRGMENIEGFLPTLLTVWLEAAIVMTSILLLSLLLSLWFNARNPPENRTRQY